MEKKKLVIGVIGADVHAVGNAILNRALVDAGFEVTNLGVLVPQEEFIQAAVETGADAILVSSDRKSTRLNSSHANESRMPSSA